MVSSLSVIFFDYLMFEIFYIKQNFQLIPNSIFIKDTIVTKDVTHKDHYNDISSQTDAHKIILIIQY